MGTPASPTHPADHSCGTSGLACGCGYAGVRATPCRHKMTHAQLCLYADDDRYFPYLLKQKSKTTQNVTMLFAASSTGAVSRSEQPGGTAGRQRWELASGKGKEGLPARHTTVQVGFGASTASNHLKISRSQGSCYLSHLSNAQRCLKTLRLDHMQRPSHPFTPAALDSAEIPTRFLSALPATPLQGVTEGKERDIVAEVDKLRINFERENMLCYHSLHASIKPRKK